MTNDITRWINTHSEVPRLRPSVKMLSHREFMQLDIKIEKHLKLTSLLDNRNLIIVKHTPKFRVTNKKQAQGTGNSTFYMIKL